MCHWVKQIRRYGALKQYSPKRHELAHKTNLQDSWIASHHNLNYLPLVITFQHGILCFQIRGNNLQALVQHQENSTAPCKCLLSHADQASALSSQSYTKLEFMGPQHCCDGKYPDVMIKDFRALVDTMQDTTQHVTIYNGMRDMIKHESRTMPYVSDEQLHAKELCIYHGFKLLVGG